jgi:hypothetical protein
MPFDLRRSAIFLTRSSDRWKRLTSRGMPSAAALPARNAKLDCRILDELAGHRSSIVRAAVAENPSTPAKTLKRLAEDQDQSVQKAARKRMS